MLPCSLCIPAQRTYLAAYGMQSPFTLYPLPFTLYPSFTLLLRRHSSAAVVDVSLLRELCLLRFVRDILLSPVIIKSGTALVIAAFYEYN